MPTTLAQRIKAARSYADLRQQDIADACTAAGHKVSRSAVAQWEYDDERRTQPSIEHMKIAISDPLTRPSSMSSPTRACFASRATRSSRR